MWTFSQSAWKNCSTERFSEISVTTVLSRKSRPKLYFEHLALGHVRLGLELVGYRAPDEIGNRLRTPLRVIPDLSGDDLPHVFVDLDRDAVVLVGVDLVFLGQGSTPL